MGLPVHKGPKAWSSACKGYSWGKVPHIANPAISSGDRGRCPLTGLCLMQLYRWQARDLPVEGIAEPARNAHT